jgi:hypothetical protein
MFEIVSKYPRGVALLCLLCVVLGFLAYQLFSLVAELTGLFDR